MNTIEQNERELRWLWWSLVAVLLIVSIASAETFPDQFPVVRSL